MRLMFCALMCVSCSGAMGQVDDLGAALDGSSDGTTSEDGAPSEDMAMPLVVLDKTPGNYQGGCDGSGGVAIDATHFLDVNDEDQQVRIYQRGANATAVATVDVTTGIGLIAGDESDFEDAARVGDRVYVISSHGRDKNGKLAPPRYRFHALDLNGTAVTVAGYSSTLLTDLLDAARWTTPNSSVIALLDGATQPAVTTDANLAPEANGTNIEGLAAFPSAAQPGRLVVGFRNPQSGTNAILVTLLNADAMLTGARAQLGEAFLLDLGGLGVRGLAWSATHQALLILAGGKAGGPFRIYTWTGTGQPVSVATLTPPANHAPEAIIPYPNTLDVQILFDQGDLLINGITCKKAPAAQRYFTDQIVRID